MKNTQPDPSSASAAIRSLPERLRGLIDEMRRNVQYPDECLLDAIWSWRVDEWANDLEAVLAAASRSLPEHWDHLVYLIERIQALQLNGQATYWTGAKEKNLPDVETTDPYRACWFAREDDARRVAITMFGENLDRAGWRIVEHVFAAASRSLGASPEVCIWTLEDEDGSAYQTACGEMFEFNEGGPIENKARFCQCCGQPLVVGPRPAPPERQP